MDLKLGIAEASPRKAQGNAGDNARKERREKLEYGMGEILRPAGKWGAATVFPSTAKVNYSRAYGNFVMEPISISFVIARPSGFAL